MGDRSRGGTSSGSRTSAYGHNGQSTNGYTNNGHSKYGYANGYSSNGYTTNGQTTNGYANGHTKNGYTNGYTTNGYANGQTNGHANGGYANGHSSGYANGEWPPRGGTTNASNEWSRGASAAASNEWSRGTASDWPRQGTATEWPPRGGTDRERARSTTSNPGTSTGERSQGAGARPQEPKVGDDLCFDLEIEFKTGLFGGEERVRIRHLETCDKCMGNGMKPGTRVNRCKTCHGSGVTVDVQQTTLGNFHQTQQPCTSCRGTGEQAEEYCASCSGEGTLQKTKQMKLPIPPGVDNGNKLLIRGEGDVGPNGGPPGDLYIFLKVKNDTKFRRDSHEIYSDATISYLDAILGTSIIAPVVDGEVTIRVPPGTQPGQVMRLEGLGAPRLRNPDVRGDHHLTLNVEIPKVLTKEEEAHVAILRDLQKKQVW